MQVKYDDMGPFVDYVNKN